MCVPAIGVHSNHRPALPTPIRPLTLRQLAHALHLTRYGHKNGFVPDAEYDFLWNNCSSRFPVDLARGVWGAAAVESARRRKSSDDPACVLANRKFQAQTSRGFSQDWSLAWINDLTLYGPAAVVPFTQPGSLNYLCAQYMMQDSVKAALHLESSPATSWPGPGAGWSYRSDYVRCTPWRAPRTPLYQ
jgi:cathepsin A (carboxypeptidase C)